MGFGPHGWLRDDHRCLERRNEPGGRMVLPDRIELSTSPLPMECSTTELRQHAPDWRIGQKGLHKAGRSLPQGQEARKRRERCPIAQGTKYAAPVAAGKANRTMAAPANGQVNRSAMKDRGNNSEARSGKAAKDQRGARLKQALRENLKRRKSQARQRADFDATSRPMLMMWPVRAKKARINSRLAARIGRGISSGSVPERGGEHVGRGHDGTRSQSGNAALPAPFRAMSRLSRH